MARTRAMRRRSPSPAGGQVPVVRQPSTSIRKGKTARRTRPYIGRRHSLRRREKVLGSRPLLSARRQASIRQPPPRKGREALLEHPALCHQPSLRPRQSPPGQQAAPDISVRLSPSPVQVQRPTVHFNSLERQIIPPPRKRKRDPVRRQPTIRRRKSLAQAPAAPPLDVTAANINSKRSLARRTPTIRRDAALAWEGPEEPVPNYREVARIIIRERNLPRIMAGMNDQERRMIHAALEDGTLPPHDFSPSQLAWAGIIARAKPMGMDMRYFIQKLLKRTREGKNVPQDKQLCFDSLDFLKHLLHEKQEKALEWKGKYEEERIRRKRLEQLLKQSEDRHQLRRPGDGVDHATQLVTDHQREVDGDVNMGDGYPNIEEANTVAQQPEQRNIPLACYVLLRHARALHALLLDHNISPTRLASCILKTIELISDVIESTSHHEYTHYTKEELRQTLKVASSVFAICLRGLQHLCRDISGRREKPRVIYQLCAVFKTTLKHNEKLAQKVAKEAYAVARDHLPLAQRRAMSGLELHEIEVPYLLSLRTEFLASIFLSKEFSTMPRPRCYTEVLEGMSAELYTKVGTLISETVFKEKVTESNLLGRISLIPPDRRANEVSELAVAVERDQVLKLLRVVVRRLSSSVGEGGAEGEVQDTPTLHLAQLISTEKLLTGTEGSHGRLFKVAKVKLQHTLCKAAFGENDGEFAQALKGAQWEDEWGGPEVRNAAGGEVVVNDEGEKFVEGIWEMVGWDILEEI